MGAGRDLSRDEIVTRARGCQGLFVTTVEPIDAALVAALPDLKAVCSMAFSGSRP